MEQFANLSDSPELTPQKNNTLKVLGILSIVLAGLLILASLFNLRNFAMTDEDIDVQFEQVSQYYPDMDYEQFADSVRMGGPKAVTDILTNIICIIGVVMMLRKNKKGFYIYIFAELLPYITAAFFGGYDSSKTSAFIKIDGAENIVWIMFAVMLALDSLFIFLYYKQVKKFPV